MKRTAILSKLKGLKENKPTLMYGMEGEGRSEIYDVIVNEFGPQLAIDPKEVKANSTEWKRLVGLMKEKLLAKGFKEESIMQVLNIIQGHIIKTSSYKAEIIKRASKKK